VYKQTVLILEDDPAWQKILGELVEDLSYKPWVVSTLTEVQGALAARTYALAVVDISLSLAAHSDRGGVEALKIIKRLHRRLPTIVVTGHGTLDLVIETLGDLEADYFFRKDEFDRSKFKAVVRGKALPDTGLNLLSDREREVLILLSQGHTNLEIAQALTVSVNTVKKHVQSIFTKLNVNSRAAAVAKIAEESL
jgi:DNA-binding NarL/FixJ family response regulator